MKKPLLYVLSHSFGVGVACTYPAVEGWVARVERAWFGTVINNSEGGRNFFSLGSTDPQVLDIVQNIAQFNPDFFIYDLVVNDYFLSQWTPAAMEAQLVKFVDKLHAYCPALIMKGALGAPNSFGAAANSQGFTLVQYNTSITNVFSDVARVEYSITVDTRSAPFPAGTLVSPDGLHYTGDGQAQLGQAWLTTLGYPTS